MTFGPYDAPQNPGTEVWRYCNMVAAFSTIGSMFWLKW
jgi:hypothetical protein